MSATAADFPADLVTMAHPSVTGEWCEVSRWDVRFGEKGEFLGRRICTPWHRTKQEAYDDMQARLLEALA
jgi:hypothetical protein